MVFAVPGGTFHQQHHAGQGSQGTGNKKSLPSKVFGKKTRGGRSQHPGDAHKTGEKGILGGGEAFVCQGSHECHIGCGSHARRQILKGYDPGQKPNAVSHHGKPGKAGGGKGLKSPQIPRDFC